MAGNDRSHSNNLEGGQLAVVNVRTGLSAESVPQARRSRLIAAQDYFGRHALASGVAIQSQNSSVWDTDSYCEIVWGDDVLESARQDNFDLHSCEVQTTASSNTLNLIDYANHKSTDATAAVLLLIEDLIQPSFDSSYCLYHAPCVRRWYVGRCTFVSLRKLNKHGRSDHTSR